MARTIFLPLNLVDVKDCSNLSSNFSLLGTGEQLQLRGIETVVLHTAAPRSFYESLPKLRRFSDASNLRIRDTELLHLTSETHQVALSCGCRTRAVSLVGLDGFGGCVCRDVPSIGLDKEPRSGGTDIGILDKGVTVEGRRLRG